VTRLTWRVSGKDRFQRAQVGHLSPGGAGYLEAARTGQGRLTARDQAACRLLWRRCSKESSWSFPSRSPSRRSRATTPKRWPGPAPRHPAQSAKARSTSRAGTPARRNDAVACASSLHARVSRVRTGPHTGLLDEGHARSAGAPSGMAQGRDDRVLHHGLRSRRVIAECPVR